MVTYLIGTDGMDASETIADYLDREVTDGDVLEVVNVLTSGADYDERSGGEDAMAMFTERFGDGVTVNTHQFVRGKGAADEIAEYAEEVDADEILVALRRHSRTERVIFGSVAHALLQRVERPITMIPLEKAVPA